MESAVAMVASSMVCASTKAAQDKPVEQTLATLEYHLQKKNADVTQTHPNTLKLGRGLVIDPETELSPDKEADAFFQREYRTGYNLPPV